MSLLCVLFRKKYPFDTKLQYHYLDYLQTFAELKPTPCDSQPCLNDGVCTNEGASFSCECPNGFTGVICAGSLINVDLKNFYWVWRHFYHFLHILILIEFVKCQRSLKRWSFFQCFYLGVFCAGWWVAHSLPLTSCRHEVVQ